MFGLPCSGKSTWIKDNLKNFNNPIIISADALKENHPEYNPENPENIHEWSVKEAEKIFYQAIDEDKQDIIFDGGGINNSYNLRLNNYAKNNKNHTEIICINTPAEVCLERNEKRTRKVPRQAIIEKSIKFNKCLKNLEKVVDKVSIIEYFTNKNIFVDMDGTIAAYQHLPLDSFGCIDFISGEYFKNSIPVYPIIDKLKKYKEKGYNLYILSAIPDSICEKEKNEWLDKYCPFFEKENRFFIGNKKYKNVMLRNLLNKMKIDKKDVTVIDDDHQVLLNLNLLGINAIHVSMFLTESY